MPLKDISLFTHAWSFLGRSYNYNLFLGVSEFLAGALILFRKTRLTGLLMAMAIYINILIIDIEFNVANALGHATLEFVVILLLLVPYLSDLKKYFWDLAGKFEDKDSHANRLFSVYIPLGFLILVTSGFYWEMSSTLKTQDKIIGEYKVKEFILNSDTINLKGGKYTQSPMIFFEFGNTFIFSINDSTYWGDYFIKGDSISMVLDKEIYSIKNIEGGINRNNGNISGRTNNNNDITLNLINSIEK
jgi:hypothetical protein